MEISRNAFENSSLLYWILDNHHFLLCSFFTEDELENVLSEVSYKFNEKIMTIFLWRSMINQIYPSEHQIIEEEIDNSLQDFEDEETEDLIASSQLLSLEDNKAQEVKQIIPVLVTYILWYRKKKQELKYEAK